MACTPILSRLLGFSPGCQLVEILWMLIWISRGLCENFTIAVVFTDCDNSSTEYPKNAVDSAFLYASDINMSKHLNISYITYSHCTQINSFDVLEDLFLEDNTVILSSVSYQLHVVMSTLADMYEKLYVSYNSYFPVSLSYDTYSLLNSFNELAQYIGKVLDIFQWQNIVIYTLDDSYWYTLSVHIYTGLISQNFEVRIIHGKRSDMALLEVEEKEKGELG